MIGHYRMIALGGGAAGLMAGGVISSCGKTVEIVEKMSKTGIKLGIKKN